MSTSISCIVAYRVPLAHFAYPAAVEAFTCYIEFTLHSNAFINAGQLTPFITSTLSITLVLNLVATCTSAPSLPPTAYFY